jgi:molybdate transport system substrate-binding protein
LLKRFPVPRSFCLAIFAFGIPINAHASEVKVAVASNFTAPMKVIGQIFQKDTGHKASLSYGATGQFYAQIKNGAPFDILLAADEKIPAKLESEGLGVLGTQFTYATGRLVLWSKQAALIDSEGEVLKLGNFNKIAIANPKLAPYGAAAMEVINNTGLTAAITPKLVEGSNISQAFQFVSSGNAPLGFIAISQVFENGTLKTGSGWIIPSSLHKPIRQDAILLNPGKNEPAAQALMNYLRSNQAKEVIRSFGYEP